MAMWTVAIRTALIDDLVHTAIGRGVGCVVNLGAGLDTRPYRLKLPADLLWIEADSPDVIAFKAEGLASDKPRCHLRRVSLDPADREARRLFLDRVEEESDGKILILTEGLVPHLEVNEVAALADDLRSLTRVEGWIVEYISPESLAYRKRKGLDRGVGQAPLKFEPTEWFSFFKARGWRVGEMHYLPKEGRRRGRPAPLSLRTRLLKRLTRPFSSPERRARAGKNAGYAYLTPALGLATDGEFAWVNQK
jgi:methyltransferase (TIGR00027 family)